MTRTQDTNRGLKMVCSLGAAPISTTQELVELPGLAAIAQRRDAGSHPRIPEFVEWMREKKGGARYCPRGGFPDNFLFWLDGGRW